MRKGWCYIGFITLVAVLGVSFMVLNPLPQKVVCQVISMEKKSHCCGNTITIAMVICEDMLGQHPLFDGLQHDCTCCNGTTCSQPVNHGLLVYYHLLSVNKSAFLWLENKTDFYIQNGVVLVNPSPDAYQLGGIMIGFGCLFVMTAACLFFYWMQNRCRCQYHRVDVT
jgi:hypothetical protein